MMYAFGDDETPLSETVDLMEVRTARVFTPAAPAHPAAPSPTPQEIVIDYASGVLRKSMDLASLRGKSRPPLKGIGAVTAEDVMAVVRRDPKKYERVRELFDLQKELREARAGFDQDEEALKKLAEEVGAEEPGGSGGAGESPQKR